MRRGSRSRGEGERVGRETASAEMAVHARALSAGMGGAAALVSSSHRAVVQIARGALSVTIRNGGGDLWRSAACGVCVPARRGVR